MTPPAAETRTSPGLRTLRTLDEQRLEFARGRYLAMPIAGAIAWTIVGIGGALLPVGLASWVLFIATGSTFGLGVLVAKAIGEDLWERTRPPTGSTPSSSTPS